MAEKITYYAIIDEFSSRDRPGGVLRRVANDEGHVDEAFFVPTSECDPIADPRHMSVS